MSIRNSTIAVMNPNGPAWRWRSGGRCLEGPQGDWGSSQRCTGHVGLQPRLLQLGLEAQRLGDGSGEATELRVLIGSVVRHQLEPARLPSFQQGEIDVVRPEGTLGSAGVG